MSENNEDSVPVDTFSPIPDHLKNPEIIEPGPVLKRTAVLSPEDLELFLAENDKRREKVYGEFCEAYVQNYQMIRIMSILLGSSILGITIIFWMKEVFSVFRWVYIVNSLICMACILYAFFKKPIKNPFKNV